MAAVALLEQWEQREHRIDTKAQKDPSGPQGAEMLSPQLTCSSGPFPTSLLKF